MKNGGGSDLLVHLLEIINTITTENYFNNVAHATRYSAPWWRVQGEELMSRHHET